jgi:sarcosine oxidase subunit beta
VRHEVAIVGAGVTGLSVAWHLRRRGVEPVVVERSGIAAGASGIQPGGVRQQWGTEVNCRLARESAAFYQHADELLDAPPEVTLNACGYLFVARSRPALDRLRAHVELQNSLGVPSRIVSPEEARDLVPALRAAAVAGGSWCAEDGYVERPQAFVEALARGSRIVVAQVDSLEPREAGWRLGLADGSELVARRVVVAAGVDSAALLEPLGSFVPIERESRWLFLSPPMRERLLDAFVASDELRFAAKQLADGRVLASDLSAVGADRGEAAAWRRSVAESIHELLPLLEFVDFPLLLHGEYDVTPDRQAVIGPVAAGDGLWIAAGFSGHGFMLAPAVGRIVADALTGDGWDPALDAFSPARFAAGRLVREPQVI